MRRLALVLGFLCVSTDCFGFYLNGNKLHELCLTKEKSSTVRMMLRAYSMGIVDASAAYAKGNRHFCVPDGVVGDQVTDVVCKYLVENPSQRHSEAGDIATAALLTTWPCAGQ